MFVLKQSLSHLVRKKCDGLLNGHFGESKFWGPLDTACGAHELAALLVSHGHGTVLVSPFLRIFRFQNKQTGLSVF